MPKPLLEISPLVLKKFKQEVFLNIGFVVRSKSDCKKLSELMTNYDNQSLSESTLYRFFFKTPDQHHCYQNTLDKLAAFAKLDSWDVFCRTNNFEYNYTISNGFLNNQNASLIKRCIYNDEYKSLGGFMEDLPKNIDDNLKRVITLEIYIALLNNKKSNLAFYKNLSGISSIRSLFFENGIDPEFKIPDYEIGLQYYLKNVDFTKSQKDLQDYIFANCILFRYYYKAGNKDLALFYGSLLYEKNGFTLQSLSSIDIFPKSRWVGYQLLYYKLMENIKLYERSENEIIDFGRKQFPKNENFNNKIILYNTLDTFHICNSKPTVINKIKKVFVDILPEITQLNSFDSLMRHLEPNGLIRVLNNYSYL